MTKLGKMSTARLKANKKAITRLIKYYKGEIRIQGCPLCQVVHTKCAQCLWEIFKEPSEMNLTCLSCGADFRFAYKRDGSFNKPYARRQLPRLYGWRKAIDNELRRRHV